MKCEAVSFEELLERCPHFKQTKQYEMKNKILLPLLPSSEAAVLRSCYTPFQDCSIHIPGYTYIQKQTYWRTSDLRKKKKLITRFTFLFRAIQWISIVSGQKVQDLKPCTQGHVWPGPCLTLHPCLRPHKLPYSPCFNHTGLLQVLQMGLIPPVSETLHMLFPLPEWPPHFFAFKKKHFILQILAETTPLLERLPWSLSSQASVTYSYIPYILSSWH